MEDLNSILSLYKHSNLKVIRDDSVYKNMKNPRILKDYYKHDYDSILNKKDVEGISPSIFVGRFGYPKVYIGPLVSFVPRYSNLIGEPNKWSQLTSYDVVKLNLGTIRGLYKTSIKNVENGKIEEKIRDIALTNRKLDVDMNYNQSILRPYNFDRYLTPSGPSVNINSLSSGNLNSDKKLERVYSDVDLDAKHAVYALYKDKVDVYRIQNAISSGLLGIGKNRKFVPTRWGITMVDDALSKILINKIKLNPLLDSIEVYYGDYLDNRWIVILIPSSWEYEMTESWYPDTSWNLSDKVSIESSYEDYNGRTKYAEITGSYYAARLSVAEKLISRNKQAGVVILREIHKGYNLPLGVWNIREHVKDTLNNKPYLPNNYLDMFKYISSKLDVNLIEWIKAGKLINNLIHQRKL